MTITATEKAARQDLIGQRARAGDPELARKLLRDMLSGDCDGLSVASIAKRAKLGPQTVRSMKREMEAV